MAPAARERDGGHELTPHVHTLREADADGDQREQDEGERTRRERQQHEDREPPLGTLLERPNRNQR